MNKTGPDERRELKMRSFSKKTLVLAMMLAVGSAAQAAYLGQLQVTSQASQNFQATFLVHDVSPAGTSLTARLAPAETYAKYGITMPQSAKGLNLALINKSPLTLRISGNRPTTERAFPLLVELNEGGRVSVRQYNIHVGAAGTVEPVEVVSMKAAPVTAAAPVSTASSTQSQAAKKVTAAPQPKAQAAASADQTPLERMQSKNYDLSKPVIVEAGYTPWSLGVLFQKRFPNASVNQVLVALAIQNPEAFPAGNVRQLKAGAQVTAPSASLVESINAQTAREIVQKGLNIDEVARKAQPIKAAKQEAPKPKKPLPSIQTAPVKHLPPPVETVKEKPAAQTTPAVTPPAAVVPAEPTKTEPATPQVQTPASDAALNAEMPDKVTEPVETIVPEEPISAQEAMPTLEIMAEDEAPVEEESSSWFWYLLIVLMLGAAGFIYWRTKQGRYVDCESFKRVINKGKSTGLREEPVVREEPRIQPAVQTINEPTKVEPKVAPVAAAGAAAAAQTAAQSAQEPAVEATASIFDLVSDEEPAKVETAQSPSVEAKPAAVDDHSMKDSLDMARSFISIGAKNEAIVLLQEVLQKGTAADKAQAEMLMKQVHERA